MKRFVVLTSAVSPATPRRSVFRGAGWSIVLCYVPLAPLAGGVVAGRPAAGSDQPARSGLALGALAGLPPAGVLSVGTILAWLFLVGRAGGPPPARVLLLECLGLALAATVYAVGLSTAGGLLGATRPGP